MQYHEIKIDEYERVVEVRDETTGLHAIIALHNTSLGPGLGGIRAYHYPSFDAALNDVLRLAKGMTYKSAISQTGTGGAKSVIILDDPKKTKSEALLLAFGEAVNSLGGQYICAEDIGMPVSELGIIGRATTYAVGLPYPTSSGDPARFTAYGGYLGVKATAKEIWGTDSLKGRTIAFQGLGSVGMRLAEHLFWEGAKLIVTDINQKVVDRAVKEFAAQAISPDAIFDTECDLFVPCALGGILNSQTIPRLRCQGVAGLANNQLLTEEDGHALTKRGILYAPDYVINSGGLFNVCVELEKEGYNPSVAREHIERVYDLLLTIFKLSKEKKMPTNRIANELAEYNLKQGIGKREAAVIFPQ